MNNFFNNLIGKDFLFYLTVFSTGFSVLVIEILGTRIIDPFYGSTVFVWSSLISVSLGGLALGYYYGGKIADYLEFKPFVYKKIEVHSLEKLLPYILIFSGTFFILLTKFDELVLLSTDFLGVKFGPLLSSVILFTPPLFVLAMDTPIVIKIMTKTTSVLGSNTGRLFAVSTLGSLLGALLTGFFLIPYFAVSTIFNALGIFLILIGLIWVKRAYKIDFFLSKSIFFLFVIGLLIPFQFYKVPVPSLAKTIYKELSFFGDIKVYELRDGGRSAIKCILVSTSSQSCWNFLSGRSAWAYTRYFRGALNFYEEEKVLDILIIGLGGGSIVKELENTNPGHNIDIVEIDPKMIEVTDNFIDLPEREGINYIVDDGRHFIRESDKKYDLIMTDIVLGTDQALHLGTKEFFQEAKDILKPDGVLVLNAKGFLLTQKLQPMVFKTLRSVLPYVKFTARAPYEYTSIVFFASARDFNEDMFKGMIPYFFDESFWWDNKINLANFDIITDDNNPAKVLDLPVVVHGRKITIDTFGKEFYLYEP